MNRIDHIGYMKKNYPDIRTSAFYIKKSNGEEFFANAYMEKDYCAWNAMVHTLLRIRKNIITTIRK